ncbi:MAG: hypothetical protein NC401_18750, partial [Ruminococcus sp.]|nr:hypothetical protein [Ruminococcus sp.]
MINIIAAGLEYYHSADFMIERKQERDYYLALYIETPCILGVKGEKVSCKAGTFILFDKKSYQLYGADGDDYIDDWVVFDCNENFLTGLNITFNTPVYIGGAVKIKAYFSLLYDAYSRAVNNSAVTDYILGACFADISNVVEKGLGSSPHYSELLQLRRDIMGDPAKKWTIENMAKQINVSKPYIQELYFKTFGKTCVADVIEIRLSKAKNLLANTNLNG